MKKKYLSLAEAFSNLNTTDEVQRFLKDLLTIDEYEEFEKRWAIAQTLWADELTYRQIAKELDTSTTTVSRVARFLEKEPHQGYKKVLTKLSSKSR